MTIRRPDRLWPSIGVAALAAALLAFVLWPEDDPGTNPAEALLRAEPGVTILGERPGPGALTYFRLALSDGTPLCDGQEAIALAGEWTASGAWQPGGFTVACPDGAVAKCVTQGLIYPWQSDAAGARLQACVRMVRADYCGDGHGSTETGKAIRGLEPAGYSPSDATEAGWSPDGAVVIFRTRTPAGADYVRATCPDRLNRAGPWPEVLLWNE